MRPEANGAIGHHRSLEEETRCHRMYGGPRAPLGVLHPCCPTTWGAGGPQLRQDHHLWGRLRARLSAGGRDAGMSVVMSSPPRLACQVMVGFAGSGLATDEAPGGQLLVSARAVWVQGTRKARLRSRNLPTIGAGQIVRPGDLMLAPAATATTPQPGARQGAGADAHASWSASWVGATATAGAKRCCQPGAPNGG